MYQHYDNNEKTVLPSMLEHYLPQQKMAKFEVRNKVSPKSTPKSGRKRKQRFCSPKVSPAISIQDGVGPISGSTVESEDNQSPMHTPRRLRKNPTRESPRTAPHNANGKNLRVIGDEVQSFIENNKDNMSCGRGNSDTSSHKSIDLTTNEKSPISQQSDGHHKLNRAFEEESVGQKVSLEEPDVYMNHTDQSSKTEQQWITSQSFLPSQVSRLNNEAILATQKAAEVMARMNCLEKDEDILDVEIEDTEANTHTETFQALTNISSNGIHKSSRCNSSQDNSSTDNQQTEIMSDQLTEITAGHMVESLKKPTKCDVPQNVDLQKKKNVTDMNSEQKGTILSSLLEGRDQESLIAAELLTRLDRDIHLSEIQPTICLDQPNNPNYSNMGYGTSGPAQGINVANYLEHKPKKQGCSGTGTTHNDTGVEPEHRPAGDPVSCTFEAQSRLSVSENVGEIVSPVCNSLSTPATRQTASQILYQNRTGQEQLGQEYQRSHSFHGTVDNVGRELGREQSQMQRYSDPEALRWEQGQISVPTSQHNNMGIPGWDQRQKSYRQLADTDNQKDSMSFSGALKAGVQHDVASEQLSSEQINNGYRYGPMIPENSSYTHHSNVGKNKQSEAMYERRDHHDIMVPVEQDMPFGPMVEDSHYNGLPTFQSGNYLNLSQETIDNMIQNNHGPSYVGSPSIQSQPLPTNISTPDPSVHRFGDFVNYPRSSQSSEDQVQYFQPIQSKSQGPDEILPHMAKRRRRSNSAKTVNDNKSPPYIDVMNNYMYKKKQMQYEHALHPLQTKDNDSDRFFLILSPEVNADEVRDIGHKGLIAKYIDYLIVENEQITEMSKAVSIPIEHCVMDDPYLMDIIRVKIPFPTLKYYQWLRTYYPTIQIDWLALNQQMLQFQPVGDCRPHHYILDKRPPPVLLGESFYFFQRERDRLLSC